MEIEDLAIHLPGLACPPASRFAQRASVAQCPYQVGPRRCHGDMEGTIELFPDAGVWTDQRQGTVTVYTPRGKEGPLFFSKGLVVDILV